MSNAAVYLPGPEAGHNSLLESLRLHSCRDTLVGFVHVSEDLNQFDLGKVELRRDQSENQFYSLDPQENCNRE